MEIMRMRIIVGKASRGTITGGLGLYAGKEIVIFKRVVISNASTQKQESKQC